MTYPINPYRATELPSPVRNNINFGLLSIGLRNQAEKTDVRLTFGKLGSNTGESRARIVSQRIQGLKQEKGHFEAVKEKGIYVIYFIPDDKASKRVSILTCQNIKMNGKEAKPQEIAAAMNKAVGLKQIDKK